ncbi:MAG: glycosyltransferase family 2 protein [Longimicrobiales bacterium]|nr:glycosyltransferase family 2 protein [Longimicrobiales bacterium]
MSLTPILLALPWLGLLIFEAVIARFPSELPEVDEGVKDSDVGATGEGDVAGSRDALEGPPPMSVVVPARNEAANIVACLRSLTESTYPDFEVIVVDDRSDDDTAVLARSIDRGNARRIVVVEGEELPPGWLGKPWACHQGSKVAQGEMLLFTDADTVHGPDLLRRAVAGQRQEGADLLTVVGRQIMESFWERVVQPHVFFLMLLRFPDFERVARNGNWRDAIANGQFLLFARSAYERIGGHTSVKDEVVEDLALAQVVKRSGLQLRIRSAEESLATRMYQSLGHLVEGWSKNMLMGGLQSVPRQLRLVLPPISFVGGLMLWLLAPAVLVAGLLGLVSGVGPGESWLWWAGTVYGLTVVMWLHWYGRMRAPRGYAFLYPLAAAVFAYIFLRSWMRGRNVEWKGRHYEVPAASERP